jgi:predicted Zn-dependent protease
MAGIAIRSGQAARARAHLEAASRISRGGPALCVLRGRLHLAQGEMPQAIQEFRDAAAILENGWTLSHLAHANAHSGNRKEAEQLEGRIRQVAPNSFYDLAVVNRALGRHSEAANLLAEARRAHDPQLVWLRVDARMADLGATTR